MDSVKPEECESCGFETGELEQHGDGWYCRLCAGTMASRESRYPSPNTNVLRAICFVGNAIIAEIRGKRV